MRIVFFRHPGVSVAKLRSDNPQRNSAHCKRARVGVAENVKCWGRIDAFSTPPVLATRIVAGLDAEIHVMRISESRCPSFILPSRGRPGGRELYELMLYQIDSYACGSARVYPAQSL
jgi:hypothetical protein